MSPSLRGRGLKFKYVHRVCIVFVVALFTRAWIEIKYFVLRYIPYQVALFTRAWIEIDKSLIIIISIFSRPLYEGVD